MMSSRFDEHDFEDEEDETSGWGATIGGGIGLIGLVILFLWFFDHLEGTIVDDFMNFVFNFD